ncbi:hypothetical protein BX070DRAFT_192830 [Coemansia spiralis]|nr:hypothetical protein BX070DRAFT_192830 [Coemansia spiralis]
MGKIDLQLKADLSNVTDFIVGDEHYHWNFRFECTSCHEKSENLATISTEDSSQISGSRGEANLVMRCKFCNREGAASIVSKPKAYTAENSGRYATILTIECRGMEPVEIGPTPGWVAKSTESKQSFEVDPSEGEWYDYDDEASVEVSITDVESQFVRSKEK